MRLYYPLPIENRLWASRPTILVDIVAHTEIYELDDDHSL